jgi:hypothetical protein
MFLIRQADQLRRSCSTSVLERDMAGYKKLHPGCSEQDVMKNVLKHTVPSSMPGTPGWHYNSLQDLLHMVERLGLPHLFVTVTADEVSELRWTSIVDVEEQLQCFSQSFTYKVGLPCLRACPARGPALWCPACGALLEGLPCSRACLAMLQRLPCHA